MYNKNEADFRPIEFKKRGPKSAEEKRNIKQGLKKFWDKKGRAVITVGAGVAGAAGALTLAAKSGKVPMPGKAKMHHPNVKAQGLLPGGKSPKGLLPPGSGVNSVSRKIPGTNSLDNGVMTVKGAKDAAKQVINSGRQFRSQVDKGYATAKPSDAAYKVGASGAKVIKSIARRIKSRK